MIKITEKSQCCGCNACGDVCAHKAITFIQDEEGFLYPHVDTSLCTDCGLCEQVCPQLHVNELKHNDMEKPICFGANNRNIETRFNSTSGGAFSALAEEMYRRGGYVGGAINDEKWHVCHFISNNSEDLQRIRQSKYSQSDAQGFYKQVQSLLKQGEHVLVCGTPCQMAALRRFLRKDYDNLIIVDFICKYIGSPLFTEKYLEYQQNRIGSPITYFKYKDKERGWRSLTKRIDFKNGKSIYAGPQDNDIASIAFHSNLIGRPSCYECPFKGFPRMSDITLADFWGCENYEQYKELDDNIGTSAVLCNSNKGLEYFNSVQGSLKSVPAELEHILPGNRHLVDPAPKPSEKRTLFLRDLNNEPMEQIVAKYCTEEEQTPKKLSFKKKLKAIYRVLKHQWQFSGKSLCCLAPFIKWNLLSKQVCTNWFDQAVMFIAPHVEISIAKSARIELSAPLSLHSYSVFDIRRNATMECYGTFDLGAKVRFPKSHKESSFMIAAGGGFTVEKRVNFAYGTSVEVHENAELLINQCGTNTDCTIICGKKIEMTGHVALGRDVSIRDTNAHQIALDGYKITRPVLIEDHVWLCSGSSIGAGVKIRSGAIVGANSVVVSNVPAHSLVSGYPAKVVERNIAWKL